MQRGCMQRNSRKEGPDVLQFRWSKTRVDGKRLYHKKIVGTIERYPDESLALMPSWPDFKRESEPVRRAKAHRSSHKGTRTISLFFFGRLGRANSSKYAPIEQEAIALVVHPLPVFL
jgi:hypothetical protein